MYRKNILIDLDGVLNQYGQENFNENYIPDLKDGAKEFVEKLSNEADLYLFTTRNLLLVSKWLIKNKLDKYFTDITNIKIPSFLCVDDRTVCFKGNYNQTLNDISEFKPYWK